MASQKLVAGSTFPETTVAGLNGEDLVLSKPAAPSDWRLVVVYRGKHCPICTRYLIELEGILPELKKLGIDAVSVSADPKEKAEAQMADVGPSFPVGYGLTIDQMDQLGLYISHPRSPEETDRPFAEPGLFVINEAGKLQIVDISNAPFARPELSSMLMGLTFIRNPENNYPIRGTHD
ncbi:MAG: redoxin domain-containing protein [Erythrobacter sp.]